MTKRNSPNDVSSLEDLSRLDEIIVDKRNGQRADAKKNRRNRHYERQFIKNAIGTGRTLPVAEMETDRDGAMDSDTDANTDSRSDLVPDSQPASGSKRD